jgi:hypothetical protein
MEHQRIYLFKTESLNFVNLLQFCFILSRRDFYEPCIPTFDEKLLGVEIGNFCSTLSRDNPQNFRNIDWHSNLSQLDKILESTNNSIIIGNHSIKQIQLLKNYYQNRAFTVSCSYKEDWYDRLLTYKANTHIYQQATGALPLTELDTQLRKDKSVDLFKYYKNAFNEQKLIAKEINYNTDYVVLCEDFLIEDKFFEHIYNLGGHKTSNALMYYRRWQKHQLTFFTKESSYENI